VSKLFIDHGEHEEQSVKERYLTCEAGDRWPVDGSVEDKWLALHSALVESAVDELESCKDTGFWNLQMFYNLPLKDRNVVYNE